jgi:hypothetical protein
MKAKLRKLLQSKHGFDIQDGNFYHLDFLNANEILDLSKVI